MSKLNFLCVAFVALFLLSSCSKTSSDPVVALCNSVSSFTAVQQDDALKLMIGSSGSPLYYECLAVASGSPAPGSGSNGVAVPPNNSIYLKDLYVNNAGTYLIFIRAVCAVGSGNWSAPVAVNVNAYCARPHSLSYIDSYFQGFQWSVDYAPSNYQVQYGLKGFSLGSGTTATTVSTNYDDARMNAGTNYDFYVRAGCGAGWSSWVGPYTYFSAGIKNLCTAPSNVTYTVLAPGGVPNAASFSWSHNGEKKFEFTGVFQGAPIGSNTIYTYNASVTNPNIIMTAGRNTNYDFYIRAVCIDGSKTAWFGPTLFNIR